MKKILSIFAVIIMILCTTVFVSCKKNEKIYLVVCLSEVKDELGYDYSTWLDYVHIESNSTSYVYIIDSNPTDSSSATIQAQGYAVVQKIIPALHEKCGVPASVWAEMKNTTALDGRQDYSISNLTISWKYHPDNGLEVIYSATK